MTANAQSSGATEEKRARTRKERKERKSRLQTDGRPSLTRSIARALVLKHDDLFFLCQSDGSVPLKGEHGLGLYYHDCRYLNGYELTLGGVEPTALACTVALGFAGALELTNPELKLRGHGAIHKDEIGIKWERILDSETLALCDVLTFHNYGVKSIELPLSFGFRCQFQPLFAVRGMFAAKLGKLQQPSWHAGTLTFGYAGADGIHRKLSVYFSPEPQWTRKTSAGFEIQLKPDSETEIRISLCLGESKQSFHGKPAKRPRNDLTGLRTRLQHSSNEWLAEITELRSNNSLLNDVMERSLRDLLLLRTHFEGEHFFAAGVPWFVTLFGRDSLIASLETLAFKPEIAEQTLRLMARYQGTRTDKWRDEQPGKIMHEIRVGEMAHLNEIPQTPYYGSVDATPLFLILVARHAAWTGELQLFDDLRHHIDAALSWIAEYGDRNGDGYIEYENSSTGGLTNQGWKDSGDAIMNSDGTLASPPISLVEVQGYVYLAKLSIAELYERAGDRNRADDLRGEARALRTRFNQDFWLDDRNYYALALQAEDRPAAVVASNPGQALWSGIVDPEKAAAVVEKLMSDEMFSGWGIRTLSRREKRYNPIGYHLGTVWPHDNALIAAGLHRYGFDRQACRVFTAIVKAAQHFEHHRLPEVFAGFSRADYAVPVHYPVACHPQAWAAGAVPYMAETALGLIPEAFERRLRICRPVLPESIRWLEVRRLRVGNGSADLRFERTNHGAIRCRILEVTGDLEVIVEEHRTPEVDDGPHHSDFKSASG